MSLISRLRAVVAGDDYLDGELDDFAYEDEQQDQDQRATQADGGALATLGDSNPFDLGGDLPGLQRDWHARDQYCSGRGEPDGAPQLR